MFHIGNTFRNQRKNLENVELPTYKHAEKIMELQFPGTPSKQETLLLFGMHKDQATF